MASIEWRNLTFTGKEFIGAVAFVLTMSGVWYNNQFKIEENRTSIKEHVVEAKAKWERIDKLEARVAELENKERIRDAVQEYNRGYYPMKKVKGQ